MIKGRVIPLANIPRLCTKRYITLPYHHLSQLGGTIGGYSIKTIYECETLVMMVTYYISYCNTNTIGLTYVNG